MLTAHSGSDGYADNSIEFIEAIVNSAVDAFEIDLQLSDGGDLYLSHDSVQDYTDCVSLEECLNILAKNPEMKINIDCKHPKAGPLAIELAKELGVYSQILLSGSLPLDEIDEADYPILFYNIENVPNVRNLAFPERQVILSDLSAKGIEYIQLFYGLVTVRIIDIIHEAGLKLSVWTVNDLNEITHLYEIGCDNITTRSALEYLNSIKHNRNLL